MDWTARRHTIRPTTRHDNCDNSQIKFHFIMIVNFSGRIFAIQPANSEWNNGSRELWRAHFLTTLYLCSNNNGYNDYFVTVTHTHTHTQTRQICLFVVFKHSLFSLRQRNLLNSLTLFYWMAHKERRKKINIMYEKKNPSICDYYELSILIVFSTTSTTTPRCHTRALFPCFWYGNDSAATHNGTTRTFFFWFASLSMT